MAKIYQGTSANERFVIEGSGESIIVYAGDGHDRVEAYSVWEPLRIYGEGGSDILYGGRALNRLFGGAGDDELRCTFGQYSELYGGSGRDILYGGDHGNRLDGGAGADMLYGGDGGDTYVVNSSRDVVSEFYWAQYSNDPNPVDSVEASIDYTLPTNVERLLLTGDQAISGTGNYTANLLVGNTSSNTLNGARGADTLRGGVGADTLIGGSGRDVFDYDELAEADVILDFQDGSDRIDLSTIDANGATTTNESFQFIGASAFSANATGQVRYVYDASTTTGTLYLSVDADATAELQIVITGVPSLDTLDLRL